ncbi:MAG: type II and III secretion system protein family protein [Sphingobium sp.]
MNRTISRAVALACLAGTAPLATAAAPLPMVSADPALTLSVGQSRVIDLSTPMSDVVIANPEVVDVHVRSRQQLYLIAKAPGRSDVTVTGADGRALYRSAVTVGNNLTSIDQMLGLAMPDAKIVVSTLNGMTLLTGTVAQPQDAAEAERLVTAFVGDKMTVVSRLRTATPLTVNLQVRIAEVNKTLTKSIGLNLISSDSTGGFNFGVVQGTPGNLAAGTFTNPSEGTTSFGMAGKLLGLDLLGTLDLAENQGLAATLASPNLTALSGETASFLAGGEIPIPLSTGLGQVSVEYKQYGVSLAFTPVVLADGRISMRVRPEVSQLDQSSAVRLNGYVVPGISTRRAETTVELGSGQSFMIGGLLSASNSNILDKAPLLGDLPVLGNLFKSSRFRRQETELVIIVTPYLVKPVDARTVKLPTDGYRNATDAQRLLGAMLHDGKSAGDAATKRRKGARP